MLRVESSPARVLERRVDWRKVRWVAPYRGPRRRAPLGGRALRPRAAEPRTMRRLALLALVMLLALLMLAPGGVAGQTPWESPRMLSPQLVGGVGLYYVRFAALPGDGMGGFLTFSPAGLPDGVSLRVGAAEGAGGTTAGFAGVDVTAPLARRSEARPINLSWNAGAGLAVGEYLVATLPFGVAAGRAWAVGPLWLGPYVGTRVVMDLRFGELAPDEVVELSPGVDVGLDATLTRTQRAVLRFSASLGDRSALALGVVLGR